MGIEYSNEKKWVAEQRFLKCVFKVSNGLRKTVFDEERNLSS